MHGFMEELMKKNLPEDWLMHSDCQVWEVCDLKKVRGCKEGTRGKSQRCLSSTAGSAYVAIELMATGRRDLRSKPEELFLFVFVQKYQNYFEIISHKSGVFL